MIQLTPFVAVNRKHVTHVKQQGSCVTVHFISGQYITMSDSLLRDVLELLG
jgi:hypothetical protein